MNRNIEEILKEIGDKDVPAEVHKIAEETSGKFSKTLMQSRKIVLWQSITKSRITKLAAAAVVIIAVLVGVYRFGGFIDGTSVAWAGLAERVEQIDTFICRMRQAETSGPKYEGFEFVSKKESVGYHSLEYGVRVDSYMNGELSISSYTLPAEKVLIGIIHPAKQYERIPLEEAKLKEMDTKVDPRWIVKKFMSAEYKDLGRDRIEGIDVEGIEINDPKVLEDSLPPIESLVGRLWVDVETGLPVWVEVEFIPRGSIVRTTMVIDQFQWNVDLSSDVFEPNIPADYTLMPRHEPSRPLAQKQESVVEGEAWDMESPDLESLNLLGVQIDLSKSTVPLVGMNQIWRAQDEIMSTWPSYSEVREQLYEELRVKLDLDTLSNEQLVATAVALREKFWEAGGCLSEVSYPYGYSARILFEIAHDQNPENMTITDELVETVQSIELAWTYEADSDEKIRNITLRDSLIELRSAQFKQIEGEVEQGRVPTWEDFVRANDLAILLSIADDYESALEVIEWIIKEADRGGWTAYMKPIKYTRRRFNEGKRSYYNILRRTKSEFPEEFRHGRRLPSFKGPNKLGATPVHLLESNPVWTGT